MTRLGYVLVTAITAELFAGLFVVIAVTSPQPCFMWNASASAPVGLYRITSGTALAAGEAVAIRPPEPLARYLDERRYLPVGVPLLKHVAATSGMRVCRKGATVSVNGRRVAIARTADSKGRSLPVWRGCRVVAGDEVFLLNAAPDSMDGRYFGPIPLSGLVGRATPVLTRNGPAQPLVWQGLAVPPLPRPQAGDKIDG